MQLVKRYKFDQTIDPDWNPIGTLRTAESNAVIEEGALSLWSREYTGTQKGDPWRGGSVVLELPRTYGKYAVDLRVDPGANTKALAMLIFPSAGYDEDQEIDFLEQGGNLNADRHMIACSAHYGTDEMVRRTLPEKGGDPLTTTEWCTVVCNWQPFQITYVWRPLGDYTKQQSIQIPNPGVFQPLKLHLTHWPHYSKTGGPWPEAPSRMQVKEVRIWQ